MIVPILMWLPEEIADEYDKRCKNYPDLDSQIILREMARDGVL